LIISAIFTDFFKSYFYVNFSYFYANFSYFMLTISACHRPGKSSSATRHSEPTQQFAVQSSGRTSSQDGLPLDVRPGGPEAAPTRGAAEWDGGKRLAFFIAPANVDTVAIILL
jgi:hypothetical protein